MIRKTVMRFKIPMIIFALLFFLPTISGCEGCRKGKEAPVSSQDVPAPKPMPVILETREAQVFEDFVFFLPPEWERAPKKEEDAQGSYLFGNEKIDPKGKPHILIINYSSKNFGSESQLENHLKQYAAKWQKEHPGKPEPESIQLAGIKTLRTIDKLEGKGGEEPSTLFGLFLVRGNKMYTMALMVPGKDALWPKYTEDLFKRLRFRDEIQEAWNRGPSFISALQHAAEDFRITSKYDPFLALKRYAEKPVYQKFISFDHGLWPVVGPERGWRRFMEQAVISFGKENEKGTVVSYYHPWSDLFLLTLWRRGSSGEIFMADAEVLLGDALRNQGKPPFKTQAAWEREKAFAPFAIGLATHHSIESFERLFGPNSNVSQDWRMALNLLQDKKLLKSNYYGGGVALAAVEASLSEVIDPEDKNSTPGKIRNNMIEMLDLVKKGKVDQVLAEAKETMPPTKEAIKKLSFNDWKQMKPVLFVPGDKEGVLLLSSADNPDIFMSIFFGRKGSLKRFDLMSLNAFYRERGSLEGLKK